MARIAFYATKISENISRTPEGFLLCKNCVLARTGFQQYTVSDVTKDLEEEDIKQLGLEGLNPNSPINLYRPAEEVFAPATIASGEGKPLTDEHPQEFVNPDNFLDHVRGHVQNVRKGGDPLDSGDWPLIGDILVEEVEVIDKVENRGIRELSCGYSHELEKIGDKICQVKIVINHVALVRKGRAGPEARINDSADDQLPEDLKKLVDEVEKLSASTDKSSNKDKKIIAKDVAKTNWGGKVEFSREKKMAKKESNNLLMKLMGHAIKSFANDEETSPEELAEATKEMHDKMSGDIESPEDIANAKDSKKKDEEVNKEEATDSKKKDSKCMPGVMGHEDCSEGNCMYGKGDKMKDAHSTDDRAKHHAMLDKILDEMGIGEEKQEEDSDVAELKNLLDEYLGEEAKEPEHAEEDDEEVKGGEEAEVIEPIEDSEEEEKEEMIKNDAAAALLPVISKSSKAIQKAYDSVLDRTLNNEGEFIKKFRPFVAKSRDSKLIDTFNAEVRRFKGTSKAQDGGYSFFASQAKSHKSKDSGEKKVPYQDLEDAYAKICNGEEVK